MSADVPTRSASWLRNRVRAICLPPGVPFASASAICTACLAESDGTGSGSFGSTATSIRAGRSAARACSNAGRNSPGSRTEKPKPPAASANVAKSNDGRSHPYSGLPRKSICSHLICPSVPFLITTTVTGSLSLTAVRNSPMSMVNPPSPTNAIDWRSGCATFAAARHRDPRGGGPARVRHRSPCMPVLRRRARRGERGPPGSVWP